MKCHIGSKIFLKSPFFANFHENSIFENGVAIIRFKKIEEKNSVKSVLAGLEMKAQAGQKIGQ